MANRVTEKPDLNALPLQSKTSLAYVVPANAGDPEVTVPIQIAVGGCREPMLVAIAGIHGDELDGIVALQEAWAEIDPATLRGTLVLLTAANPLSINAGLRCAPQDGLDLNRLFPGKRGGSVSQRLAFHLFHDVVLTADMVATFHGWLKSGLVIPYTEIPDGFGDPHVRQASLEAAKAFGLGVLRPTPAKPGRLQTAAVRAGVPAIESEIGGLGVSNRRNWERYLSALFDLMCHMGMWPGERKGHDEVCIVSQVEIKTPVCGLLRHHVDLNEWVEKGRLLANVVDFQGQSLAEIRSPSRALVAVQRMWPAVTVDDTAIVLFE